MTINIKPSHRGLFTARAKANGKSVAAQAAADISNPNVSTTIKRRAQFAANARKWRH